MRIATWNILSGRTPGESTVDERRFGDAVATLGADLLGLQEVDRAQQRSGGLDLTEVAAAAMGATHWMFAPALAGTPATWQGATGREGPDEPAYGIAFLSRHPVLTWDVVPLAPAPTPVPYRWSGAVPAAAGPGRAARGHRRRRGPPRRRAPGGHHPPVVPAGVQRRPAAAA